MQQHVLSNRFTAEAAVAALCGALCLVMSRHPLGLAKNTNVPEDNTGLYIDPATRGVIGGVGTIRVWHRIDPAQAGELPLSSKAVLDITVRGPCLQVVVGFPHPAQTFNDLTSVILYIATVIENYRP